MGMAQCEHTDSDGGRCGLAPDHGGGHITASVQTRQCEHTNHAGTSCIRAHGHTGIHLIGPVNRILCGESGPHNRSCVREHGHVDHHHDGETVWISVATQTCRALWAPNPREAYECMRLDGHGGFHLDDQLNMMWRSSHGDREQPIGDARHSADKAGEPSTEPPTPPNWRFSTGGYVQGALDSLRGRVERLEDWREQSAHHRILNAVERLTDTIERLTDTIEQAFAFPRPAPEPYEMKAQPTCTAAMEVSGEGYDCIRPQGHTGPHWDSSDPGNLKWALKHL